MKCNFNARVRSFAAREAGCPLDHCANRHHVDEGQTNCPECEAEGRCATCGLAAHLGMTCEQAAELSDEITAAEAAAGWDQSP